MFGFMFFVVLTMLMAFLMNWVYNTFLHRCECSSKKDIDNLERHMGKTTEEDDINQFLE